MSTPFDREDTQETQESRFDIFEWAKHCFNPNDDVMVHEFIASAITDEPARVQRRLISDWKPDWTPTATAIFVDNLLMSEAIATANFLGGRACQQIIRVARDLADHQEITYNTMLARRLHKFANRLEDAWKTWVAVGTTPDE